MSIRLWIGLSIIIVDGNVMMMIRSKCPSCLNLAFDYNLIISNQVKKNNKNKQTWLMMMSSQNFQIVFFWDHGLYEWLMIFLMEIKINRTTMMITPNNKIGLKFFSISIKKIFELSLTNFNMIFSSRSRKEIFLLLLLLLTTKMLLNRNLATCWIMKLFACLEQ